MVRVKNFPLCSDNEKDVPICFYECPQGYFASNEKKECLKCEQNCLKCSERKCIEHIGQTYFNSLLDLIKIEKDFRINKQIIKRFTIGYNYNYTLYSFFELSTEDCPINCKSCHIDYTNDKIICDECLDPTMVLHNSQCFCKNLDDFFDHDSRTCIPSCNKMQLYSKNAKECLLNCFDTSVYDLRPHPFSLGNTCVPKCPQKFYVMTEFMYFKKLECILNQASVDLGNSLSISYPNIDIKKLVCQYGVFQISQITPIFCPFSYSMNEKFKIEEKISDSLDVLLSKSNEIEFFEDFYMCLTKFSEQVLKDEDLNLLYKLGFWLVKTSSAENSHKVGISDGNHSKSFSLNFYLLRSAENLVEFRGNKFIFLLEERTSDSAFEVYFNFHIIKQSESIILFSFFGGLLNFKILNSYSFKFRLSDKSSPENIYFMRNLSSDYDTEITDDTYIPLEYNTYYFILLKKDRNPIENVKFFPTDDEFYPRINTELGSEKDLSKTLVWMICILMGGILLIGFYFFIRKKIEEKEKIKFVQMAEYDSEEEET